MDTHASTVVNCMLLALRTYPFKIYINDSNGLSAFNPIAELNLTTGSTVSKTEYPLNESPPTNPSARDFITDCFKQSPRRPYEIPWEQKAGWAFLFGSMLFIAIIGNCIVIWIILAHREMRTITNYFLLNLSIADLLMSSLNCMFNFIYMLNSDWPFGSFYCSLNNFMGNVTVATSVFTLVAISFDRYVAIVRPLHRRNSRKKARLFVIMIWLLSSMLSLPCLFYSTTESKIYDSGKRRVVCYILWPDGKYPTSVTDYIYNVVFLVLTYGIPMLIMVVCYTIMGKVLWGSKSIGEHTQRQIESIQSKKKVVRMFIAVVTIFGICWLPYHLFYVYSYHQPQITSSNYVPHLFLAFYWLAMSNSMVNPIIYYWMNRRFRHYFQKIVCCCCFHLWQHSELLKSETAYMPNSISIERRSRSFRQRCNNSIRLSEINNHSTKTIQQVLYVRDNKMKTESLFVDNDESPAGSNSNNVNFI